MYVKVGCKGNTVVNHFAAMASWIKEILTEGRYSKSSEIAGIRTLWRDSAIQTGLPVIDLQHLWLVSLLVRLEHLLQLPGDHVAPQYREISHEL